MMSCSFLYVCIHRHVHRMLLRFVSVNYKLPVYFTSCLRIGFLQMLSQSTEKTRVLFCFGQLYLYLVSIIFTCNIQSCWIYNIMLKKIIPKCTWSHFRKEGFTGFFPRSNVEMMIKIDIFCWFNFFCFVCGILKKRLQCILYAKKKKKIVNDVLCSMAKLEIALIINSLQTFFILSI